jgi:hypothetical protein
LATPIALSEKKNDARVDRGRAAQTRPASQVRRSGIRLASFFLYILVFLKK